MAGQQNLQRLAGLQIGGLRLITCLNLAGATVTKQAIHPSISLRFLGFARFYFIAVTVDGNRRNKQFCLLTLLVCAVILALQSGFFS